MVKHYRAAVFSQKIVRSARFDNPPVSLCAIIVLCNNPLCFPESFKKISQIKSHEIAQFMRKKSPRDLLSLK